MRVFVCVCVCVLWISLKALHDYIEQKNGLELDLIHSHKRSVDTILQQSHKQIRTFTLTKSKNFFKKVARLKFAENVFDINLIQLMHQFTVI